MTVEEVIAWEKKLIEAIKFSDVEFLESVLHDDLLFITPDGSTIRKKDDLDSHRKGEMEVQKLEPHFDDVKIFGDTAMVVVVYNTIGRMLNNPIKGRFKYIRFWKQEDGKLRIIGGSCTILRT